MNRNFIKRITVLTMLSVSVFTGLSLKANAEWRQSGSDWYYYNSDGTLVKNTIIDGKYQVGTDGSWLQNNNIPITVPSTWTRPTNSSYEMKNKSTLVYQAKDLNGFPYDKAIWNMCLPIIRNKNNSDITKKTVKYHDHIGVCYEYTSNTDGKIKKNYFIIIEATTKLYGFMLSGEDNNSFNLDKIDLENVLNTTLIG